VAVVRVVVSVAVVVGFRAEWGLNCCPGAGHGSGLWQPWGIGEAFGKMSSVLPPIV